MKNAIVALMALVLVTLASIVPWADAQQKPSNVLIWCQNTNGTSSPCVAGNSLDYDSGGGTVNQSTIGLVFPASGGPVAAPGNATDGLLVNLGANNDVTVTSGTVTANAGTNLNTSALLTTAAHDAAFGTAGSPDAQVRSIQGIASGTPVGVQSNGANLATEATVGTLLTSATFTGRLPAAFASADNIAAQTATALHGLTYIWDGANWDRWTGAVSQSGTWTVTANAGTNLNTSALLTTAAHDAAFGTAGSADTQVRTVQGIASMTPLLVNPGTASNFGVYVEDVAETAGKNLAMAGSVRRDTAAASANASGDNATINTDANGLLWARMADPCSALAKTYLPINISTATTTEITPSLAGASNHYYVCSINIGPVAGAQNLALVDDDTDNCASVTSGIAGGTTAGSGWNIAANGGLTMGNGLGSIARTGGTNRVLCLVSSAAVQTSGVITVVAAP